MHRFLVTVVLLAATSASAQNLRLHYAITGEEAWDRVGSLLAVPGDLDGDGVLDLLVRRAEGPVEEGQLIIVLHSGVDGRELRRFKKEGRGYGGAIGVGGDLDADGVPDFVIEGFGGIEVYSGRTLEQVGFHEGLPAIGWEPLSMQIVDDIDGDGHDDLVVGDPQERESAIAISTYGRVMLLSGRTRETVWYRSGEHEDDEFGAGVVVVGDVNGDGHRDVAAPLERRGLRIRQRQDPEEIWILDVRTGEVLRRLTLGVPPVHLSTVAPLDDIDGDGVDDVAAGAWEYPRYGSPGAGTVVAFSGATGDILWQVVGEDPDRHEWGLAYFGERLGHRLLAVKDQDGDGLSDILVQSPRDKSLGIGDTATVALRSGRDGSLLAHYENEFGYAAFGARLAELGDLDGDSRTEFAVGAPTFSSDRRGRIYVFGYEESGAWFVRGDVDRNGVYNLSDGIEILRHLFLGAATTCPEAYDIDRNHHVNLTDAIDVFEYLFQGRYAPLPPFPECGAFRSLSPQLDCDWQCE